MLFVSGGAWAMPNSSASKRVFYGIWAQAVSRWQPHKNHAARMASRDLPARIIWTGA
jgi:hypothetical protein